MKLEDIRKLCDAVEPSFELGKEAEIYTDSKEQEQYNFFTIKDKGGNSILSSCSCCDGTWVPKKTGDFIIASRTLIPKLLAVAEAAKAEEDAIEQMETAHDNVEREGDGIAAFELAREAAIEARESKRKALAALESDA